MLEILKQPTVLSAEVAAIVAFFALIANIIVTICLAIKKARDDLSLAKLRLEQELRLAENKVKLERESADWKRKADFAESVMTDFYDSEIRIRAIRNPAAFASENEREGRMQEPANIRSARDQYYPIFSRLQRESSFFDALYAKRFRARALFGSSAAEPYDLMWDIVINIRSFVEILMRPSRPVSGDALQKMEDWVWNNSVQDDPDLVDRKSNLAVLKAEKIFGAYLLAGPMRASG